MIELGSIFTHPVRLVDQTKNTGHFAKETEGEGPGKREDRKKPSVRPESMNFNL